jgi:holo-[acyl-carrier protein] synthase
MIAGIGIDIVDIERIRVLHQRHGERFLHRVFSPGEVAFCMQRIDPSACLAARFAAKEAFLKAIGIGKSRGLNFHEVKVGGAGRPQIELSGKAKDLADEIGIKGIHVSLSHERDHAIAMVIVEVLP